jgi:hypothetical protein
VQRAEDRSGTRSAGCQMGVRCRRSWVRRGASEGGRRRGHFTKRLAEDWLREVLHQARQGTLAGQVRTGVTFADAAAEWLRYVELDRQRKPSTIAGYRVIVRS